LFDFNHVEDIYKEGYETACRYLDEVQVVSSK